MRFRVLGFFSTRSRRVGGDRDLARVVFFPAAAQRNVKRGGVGQARSARLDQADARLLMLARRIEHLQIAGGTVAVLEGHQFQAACRRLLGCRLRLQTIGIQFERAQAVRNILERRQHRALVVGRGLVEAGLGRALLCAQRAAMEQRRQQTAAHSPRFRPAAEQITGVQRERADAAGQRDLRKQIRAGDADLGSRTMQLRLGRAHVRPLPRQRRRQTDRNIVRQRQGAQINRGELHGRRKFTEIDRQLGLRLVERLAQRRQARLGGGNLRLYDEDVGHRLRADGILLFDQIELDAVVGDDFLGRVDLLAQRRFAETRRRDVRRQAQVSAFELEALLVGSSGLRLDAATHGAEQVQRVADVDTGVVQRERRRDAARGSRRPGAKTETVRIAARNAGLGVDARKQPAARRVGVFLRLSQGGLRRSDARAMSQRLLDATVQLVARECRPPTTGNIGTCEKMLCVAGRHIRACSCRRQGILAVSLHCR